MEFSLFCCAVSCLACSIAAVVSQGHALCSSLASLHFNQLASVLQIMFIPPACIAGLLGEGAVQVLYSTDEYVVDPILAAVGQLQFEVVQVRGSWGTALGLVIAR